MKELLKIMGFIGGCLFLIPLFIVYSAGYGDLKMVSHLESKAQTVQSEETNFSLVDEDKLIGILAKEIPYTYETETLKAQAVVFRTYIARRVLGIQTKGELSGYTKEEMKELWKQDFDSIYNTYREAVRATGNQIIVYNNEPIEALYHKASAGKTRDAKDVYGVDIPYLKAVESPKDNTVKQITIKKSEMGDLLRKNYSDILIDDDTLENQIQIVEKDSAEYVKSIQIGNQIILGEDFKKLLELPSSHFKIFDSGDSLIFDVSGIGHGVGFSQNGANELAKRGENYEKIIHYYYTDVSLENYSYKK